VLSISLLLPDWALVYNSFTDVIICRHFYAAVNYSNFDFYKLCIRVGGVDKTGGPFS
jgi:hypothetical protein